MSQPVKLGLVGFGKIARDQHVPAVVRTEGIDLVAVASPHSTAEGVRNYTSLEAMLLGEADLDAVVLCQPPQVRFEAARTALHAGKHVFLEKPPGASVSAVTALIDLAQQKGVTLFASWHSRYGSGVGAAKAWAAARAIDSVEISWKEDVRVWHPGQDWIWQAGGFGVFDPGINALSILTEVVGEPVRLISAELDTPSNREAPIAARLTMATASGTSITAEFDFRQTGEQTWDVVIHAEGQRLCLAHGGNSLSLDGVVQDVGAEAEYPSMYQHFVELVHSGRSDVDVAPLQLVADAFLLGRHSRTDPFNDQGIHR